MQKAKLLSHKSEMDGEVLERDSRNSDRGGMEKAHSEQAQGSHNNFMEILVV